MHAQRLGRETASSRLLTGLGAFPGAGLLHKEQHRHGKPDQRNQIHRQRAHGQLLLQRVRGGGSVQHRRDSGRSHLQHRRFDSSPMSKAVGVRRETRRDMSPSHCSRQVRGREETTSKWRCRRWDSALTTPANRYGVPPRSPPTLPGTLSLPPTHWGRQTCALLRDTFQNVLEEVWNESEAMR